MRNGATITRETEIRAYNSVNKGLGSEQYLSFASIAAERIAKYPFFFSL